MTGGKRTSKSRRRNESGAGGRGTGPKAYRREVATRSGRGNEGTGGRQMDAGQEVKVQGRRCGLARWRQQRGEVGRGLERRGRKGKQASAREWSSVSPSLGPNVEGAEEVDATGAEAAAAVAAAERVGK